MRYLLSIKDKEVVSKFSKFTVNKNISKNRIYIYIYIYIHTYMYIYIQAHFRLGITRNQGLRLFLTNSNKIDN